MTISGSRAPYSICSMRPKWRLCSNSTEGMAGFLDVIVQRQLERFDKMQSDYGAKVRAAFKGQLSS